ncbi:type III pantothenate kinase [Flavobacterium sp. J49]|uniref:type III pantothenate kinase n=1 Tax=Flavobacterium sp. J49 TaxID=2718534 RepID=UPI00159386CE|nr:type III pantothenate kinase [Flavobacterium sp. J49]MBF6641843.1 type III pantothenate kinase [Flavobacterium sp. J49]NIC03090.1 type III pantothenate kinase [Flavobacterium sp. J49]
MLLAIDVGNTRIKSAVFEDDTLLTVIVFDKKEVVEKINFILDQHLKINHIVVASVGNITQTDFLCFEKRASVYFITHQSKFPFVNLYSTPATLGIDRMVLATAATLQFPNQNRLVIDAGTCITYDFVDEHNQYLGGAISPGIRLRYESLHQFTAKLPLLKKAYPEYVIGNSTQESIHSGVVNGITLEIDGFIEQYKSQYAKFIIILTGGDAEFLAKRLKNTIFANSNFLLEGLNQTFQYNQK